MGNCPAVGCACSGPLTGMVGVDRTGAILGDGFELLFLVVFPVDSVGARLKYVVEAEELVGATGGFTGMGVTRILLEGIDEVTEGCIGLSVTAIPTAGTISGPGSCDKEGVKDTGVAERTRAGEGFTEISLAL